MNGNIILNNTNLDTVTNQNVQTERADGKIKNIAKTKKENFSKEFDSKLSETKNSNNKHEIIKTEVHNSEKTTKKTQNKTPKKNKKNKKYGKEKHDVNIKVASEQNINMIQLQKNHVKKLHLNLKSASKIDNFKKKQINQKAIVTQKKQVESNKSMNQSKNKILFSNNDKILKSEVSDKKNNMEKTLKSVKKQLVNKKISKILIPEKGKTSIQNKEETKKVKNISVKNNKKTELNIINKKQDTKKINIKIRTYYQPVKKDNIEKIGTKTTNNKPNATHNILIMKKFENIISTHEKFSTDQNRSNTKENHNFFSFNHEKFDNKLSKLFSTEKSETKFSEFSDKIDFKKILDKIKEAVKPPVKNEITIQLKPENLGKLKILLTMEHNTLKGKIITEHRDVQQTILNNFNQLETSLKEKGINLSNFNVTVDNENFSKEHQNNKKSFQSNKKGRKNNVFSVFNNEDILETEENIRLEYKLPYNFNNLNIII